MHKFLYIFLLGAFTFTACKSGKVVKNKPNWVQQRPTNELYYVGVGIASKVNNPYDFQQVAKKNAINDLISEIKVSVSSNSVLSQFQNNKEFSQQFESDVKITAVNTIESFNVVDSWEDKDYFWIYYRLSKDEYQQAKRKKMEAASEQAENYFTRAESFGKEQLTQSLRLKVKALAAVQLYLNEDLQTMHNGHSVYLVNELVNSIQNQLYEIELISSTTSLQGKVGKPITEPFTVTAQYRNDKFIIPFLPITTSSETFIEGTKATETDQAGIASIAIAKITDKSPVQVLRVSADFKTIIKVDSLNQTLQNILLAMDAPSTSIRLNIVPIKIFVESTELNLSQKMESNYLESTIKNKLASDGCIFIGNPTLADYILKINANTRAEGNIWGNMKTTALNMTISLVDNAQNIEIFKDGFRELKGFQLTDEKAGLDAYKIATEQLFIKIYPSLKGEIFKGDK